MGATGGWSPLDRGTKSAPKCRFPQTPRALRRAGTKVRPPDTPSERPMALVKTSKIGAGSGKVQVPVITAAAPAKPKTTARPRATVSGARPDKAAEGFAAATEEWASGLSQASAAAEELRQSMQQIAAGAEEAAGASQEQLAATKRIIVNLGAAKTRAGDTKRQTEAVQAVLTETSALITNSVRAIER